MLFDTSHGVIERLSFDSFTEAIERAPLTNSPALKRSIHNDKLDSHFFGVTSVKQAQALAIEGWPEGRKKFRALVDSLNIDSKILKPEIIYDVVGDGGFDIGRAISGVPEFVMDWRETETLETNPNGRIIKLVFNCVTSGMVSTDIIETRGAAVMALIDALETAGRRVELDICYYIGANGSAKVHHISVPLKRLDFAAQEDQILYALAHPSFMRVYMFSLLSIAGKAGLRSANSSCGNFGLERDYPLEADLVIGSGYGLDSQWRSVANAKAWLVKTLESFGVSLSTE